VCLCVPNASAIIIITNTTTTTTTIIDDVIRWDGSAGIDILQTNASLLYNHRHRGHENILWPRVRPILLLIVPTAYHTNRRVTCRFRCSSVCVCVCVFFTRSNVKTRRVTRVCVRRYDGKTWSSRSRKAVRGEVSSEVIRWGG